MKTNKIKQKLTAMLMSTIIVGTHLLTLGSQVIANADILSKQNNKTNYANVEFDTYLEQNSHEKTFDIQDGGKMYVELEIKEKGYLKNAIVKFDDGNFSLDSSKIDQKYIQKIENQTIYLKQINCNETVLIEVPFNLSRQNKIDVNLFNKTSQTKFIATYIDGSGTEKTVEKTVENLVKWQANPQMQIGGEITKYIPYHIGEEYGIFMQAKINSKLENNLVPIKQTNLKLTLPSMQNQKPTRASVIANTTKATNGKQTGLEFDQNNYSYDGQTGILTIQTQNKPDENQKIVWGNGQDEYLVNYIYVGKELYDNASSIKDEIQVEASIEVYTAEETKLEEQGNMPYELQEPKGNLADFSLEATNDISKGYIYANYAKDEKEQQGINTEEKKQTTFELTYGTQIYDKVLNNQIQLNISGEIFLSDKQYQAGKSIFTKQIKVEEANFKKILGEEGKIEVYSKSKELLGTLSKENYVLDIENKQINEITIKTTAPIAEGNLSIKVQKAFNTQAIYEKEQMQTFTKLKTQVTSSTNAANQEITKEINLQEPISKAQISIEEGKQNLSTIVKNKDVNINIVLDTSSIENALYKNPVIQILMPSQVQKVEIKDKNIMLDDELKIKEAKVIEISGRQVIQLELEGTQTKYYAAENTMQKNVISKGANIILKTDITLDMLATNKTETLQMYYTNQNTNLYEKVANKANARKTADSQNNNVGIATTDIEIVAPAGVTATTIVNGYDDEGSEIRNITQELSKDQIAIGSSKKQVNMQGIVTNNYANSITDVMILGRLPFNNNKAVDASQSLGSNFTMPLTSTITINGIDQNKLRVYYSENAEATKDLINAQNAWQENPASLSNVKSYLIVVTQEIAAASQFSFNYTLELPENLNYNNSTYSNYKVYYNNAAPTGAIGETKASGIVGLETGTGPELEITLTSNVEQNAVVRSHQYVRFFVNVKNTGATVAKDVKIIVDGNSEPIIKEDEDGNIHTTNTTQYLLVEFEESLNSYKKIEGNKKIISLGDIGINQTKQAEYEEQIAEIHYVGDEQGIAQEQTRQIVNQVTLTAGNIKGELKSNSYALEGKSGELSIINRINTRENQHYSKGKVIEYDVLLSQNSVMGEEEGLKNIVVNIPIPSDVKIIDAKVGNNDLTDKTQEGVEILQDKIVVTISEMNNHIDKSIHIEFEIGENTQERFSTKVTATVGNKVYTSNERYIHIGQAQVEASQLAVDKTYIPEGEKFSYNFNIKVTGKVDVENFVLEDILPEGISYLQPLVGENEQFVPEDVDKERGVKLIVTTNSEKSVMKTVLIDGQKVSVKIPIIPADTTLQIKIYVEGNLAEGEQGEKQVTNTAKIYAKNLDEIQLNSITHYIEYNENKHEEEKPNPQGRYKITGTAWLDENQDGQRQETESILSGIKVLLVYKTNSQIVKDVETKEEKVTTTDSNGKYEFTNLPPEEYLVIFLYDTSKFGVTQYKKAGVSQSYNSDAMAMKITLEGKQTLAGVTNTIRITRANQRDIDIGLVTAQNFDLKLDKYINKITLTTPTIGTKVYEYNNSKLEKIEVLSKNVNKSSIIVEYKIVVTNEGSLPGYARKIADYMPEDAKFNTEINKDWYLSNDKQSVYNASLAENIINPGESKEVTLVLSFNITDKNIGELLSNTAEIYESYNEQGTPDLDSEPGNLVENEDDMSRADIVLSVVTGMTITLYITLGIAILSILITGIIFIYKKVLNKKN